MEAKQARGRDVEENQTGRGHIAAARSQADEKERRKGRDDRQSYLAAARSQQTRWKRESNQRLESARMRREMVRDSRTAECGKKPSNALEARGRARIETRGGKLALT